MFAILGVVGTITVILLAARAHESWWRDLQAMRPGLARALDRLSAVAGASAGVLLLLGTAALYAWLAGVGSAKRITEGLPFVLAGRMTGEAWAWTATAVAVASASVGVVAVLVRAERAGPNGGRG